jgi:DNA-binding response OmpR family regulator
MLDVLLVEDEPALRDIGKFYLEQREDFKVETAEDGDIALKKILSRPFHVIISDYDMPNMNGIELLRSVKYHLPKQPFIVFTGKGREEVVIDALNLGADFYLQKGGDIKSQYAELAHKCRRASQHRVAQDQITHLARLYSFLSSVNKSVYSLREKEELIKKIARIAVEEGGFRQVSITLIHPVTNCPEVIVAENDKECSIHETLLIAPDLLPTSYALENGRYHICADHRTYQHNQDTKERYLREEILSSAAFPLHIGENTIGSITFHSSEPSFFNEEETLLLLEITETLSFGFELMDREYQQEKLEDYLHIAWHAIDASTTPTFLLDSAGKVVYGNTALTNRLGIQNDDLKGVDAIVLNLFSQKEWDLFRSFPENGGKIHRNITDDLLNTNKGEVLSIRPFTHQCLHYFWIRIEYL